MYIKIVNHNHDKRLSYHNNQYDNNVVHYYVHISISYHKTHNMLTFLASRNKPIA